MRQFFFLYHTHIHSYVQHSTAADRGETRQKGKKAVTNSEIGFIIRFMEQLNSLRIFPSTPLNPTLVANTWNVRGYFNAVNIKTEYGGWVVYHSCFKTKKPRFSSCSTDMLSCGYASVPSVSLGIFWKSEIKLVMTASSKISFNYLNQIILPRGPM